MYMILPAYQSLLHLKLVLGLENGSGPHIVKTTLDVYDDSDDSFPL